MFMTVEEVLSLCVCLCVQFFLSSGDRSPMKCQNAEVHSVLME